MKKQVSRIVVSEVMRDYRKAMGNNVPVLDTCFDIFCPDVWSGGISINGYCDYKNRIIAIKGGTPPETLWHEICHSYQSTSNVDWKAYNSSDSAYREHPLEVEAREVARLVGIRLQDRRCYDMIICHKSYIRQMDNIWHMIKLSRHHGELITKGLTRGAKKIVQQCWTKEKS
jgi:hypothetical protein